MIAIDDILRLTQFFRLGSIEAVNVSFWKVEEAGGLAGLTMSDVIFMIAESWHGIVGDLVMNTNAEYYRTLLEIAPDFMEFGENVFVRPGGQAGDAAPSFVAAQVKQLVSSRITRGGYKRLPFLIEANVSGNDFTTTPVIREGIETLYGDAWTVEHPDYPTTSIGLLPVIIGRTNMGTEAEPDYQLDFTKVNPVTSASLTRVTHQNSRDS